MQPTVSQEMYNRMTPPERERIHKAGYDIIGCSPAEVVGHLGPIGPISQTESQARPIIRATFDNMTPQHRHAFITAGGRVV